MAGLDVYFFDGQVKITQPHEGYRAGTDAILLAASIQAEAGEDVLELGCGTGIVMLLAAHHNKNARFRGLEKSEEMLMLARANTKDADTIHIEQGSIRKLPKDWHLKFEQVLANPPYFDDRAAIRMSKDKEAAFVNKKGLTLEDWLAAMLLALKPRGYGTLIYRADGLEKILCGLSGKAGQIRILPIHSFADQPAKRILVRFRKGVKSESALLPPLIMHERDSLERYSPQATEILAGRKRIILS